VPESLRRWQADGTGTQGREPVPQRPHDELGRRVAEKRAPALQLVDGGFELSLFLPEVA
jgi:hypothetical protein